MLAVRIAGCACLVSVSSSSGPSKQSFEIEKPSARSALSNTARAAGDAATSVLPMPTVCVPCPGNNQASVIVRAPKNPPLDADERAAPRDAVAERAHQHGVPALDTPVAQALVESDRYRRARGVAVALDVEHEAVERDAETQRHLRDDSKVRLVGHHPSDVARRELRAFEGGARSLGQILHGDLEDVLTDHEHFVAVGSERLGGEAL